MIGPGSPAGRMTFSDMPTWESSSGFGSPHTPEEFIVVCPVRLMALRVRPGGFRPHMGLQAIASTFKS